MQESIDGCEAVDGEVTMKKESRGLFGSGPDLNRRVRIRLAALLMVMHPGAKIFLRGFSQFSLGEL